MEIRYFDVDLAWVQGLDLERSARSQRTSTLDCGIWQVEPLGWTILHFLAPVDHGLWLLRSYKAFDSSLRAVFSVFRPGTTEIDDAGVAHFEAVLNEMRIARSSPHAALCFGVYPGLWGDRFGPRRVGGRIFRRYWSVAVPTPAAERTRSYFDAQASQFGARSVAPVGEEHKLFIAGSVESTEDGRLLLGLVSRMEQPTRAEVRQRLLGLIEDEQARLRFAASLHPGMKFAGAFRAPDLRDMAPAWKDECIEIACLRVRLMCLLAWPHALEWMRAEVVRAGEGSPYAHLLPEIDAVLARYPVVVIDPLGLAGHRVGAG